MKKRLIIAGMHRCGTSFFASWMKDMGLSLGEKLIGATPSNTRGHFEDLAIVEFHEELLHYNQTNLYESSDKKMIFNESHIAKARLLVSLRDEQNDQWGWKQPRATLFLELWNQLGVDFLYVFLIRDPMDVVNSLIRREAHKFLYKFDEETGPLKRQTYLSNVAEHALKYIAMYERHMYEVIQFIDSKEETRTLIADFHDFPSVGRSYYEFLKVQWGLQLEWCDPKAILSPDMKIKGKEFLFSEKQSFEKCYDQYRYLQDLCLGA
jgi:hypothetical protein